MTRIVCRPTDPVVGDLPGNRTRTLAALREAVDAGADLVVLPELTTSGYVFSSVEEAESVAVGADHDLFGEWATEAARGDAVVVGGFCERGQDGRLHNSAAVVDGDGVRAVYRKLHLWDEEKRFFVPGAEAPPVLDTRFGRLAVVICYDLEFPELTRSLALAGADVLAVPTNWPLVPRPTGERPPEVVIAMAAARVNRVVVACCDRTGVERGQEWSRGTTIVGSDGWPVAASEAAEVVVADVDLQATRDKRLTPRAHLFEDRRPEFYGAVACGSDPTPEALPG